MITKNDFREWQKNKCTIEIFKCLASSKEYYLQSLLEGITTNYNNDANVLLQIGHMIGRINAYNDFLTIEYEDLDNITEETPGITED